MSPLRIETERSFERTDTSRGIAQTVRKTESLIKESDKSFTVTSSDAALILGVTVTTLFRRLRSLGLESGIQRQRIGSWRAARIIDDETLLRLAQAGDQAVVQKNDETGLTEISSSTSKALLDIRWGSKKSKKPRSRGSSRS